VVEDAFFARFFPDLNSDATTAYYRTLKRHLSADAKVLDLGCGDNRRLSGYRIGRREVWGTDFQAHPGLVHGDWFRPLTPEGRIPFPENFFHLVGCSWVLEHVAAPRGFLAEVRRVLRPGGRLVALTPNGGHYVTWLSRLLGLVPHEVTQAVVARLYGRPPRDTFPAHYRLNTVRQLRRGARAAGLHVDEVAGFPNPEYFAFWEPLRRAAVVADWLLEQGRPGLGRLYWVATLHKPVEAADVVRAA
jgi:SAM-dependent methyltransferase